MSDQDAVVFAAIRECEQAHTQAVVSANEREREQFERDEAKMRRLAARGGRRGA